MTKGFTDTEKKIHRLICGDEELPYNYRITLEDVILALSKRFIGLDGIFAGTSVIRGREIGVWQHSNYLDGDGDLDDFLFVWIARKDFSEQSLMTKNNIHNLLLND